MRRPIIAGNWKLNKTIPEAIDLVARLKRSLYDVTDTDIVVCPSFTAIAEVAETLSESTIAVGGQDLYWEASGAFTGEVSGAQLKDAGCSYVIIGHSERRQFFGETDATVNKKIKAALAAGLTPIVCVGELLQERESGKTEEVIRVQVQGSLANLTEDEMSGIVIAYEPVWAIGTGKVATPQQAQDVHKFIRGLLEKMFGKAVASQVRIQYGGSVKPSNVKELMAAPDIDGALVGGASLDADQFIQLVKYK
ncbi:MAG TPA: triose-phosphate isomerase [bacterium]|nr:triose-phosphate isomerase [bacterium]